MLFVTLETLLGITCPLTSLENILRGITQSESFVGYWIQKLIYWDFPTQIFIILYCIFLGWTLLMWKIFPPKQLARKCVRKNFKWYWVVDSIHQTLTCDFCFETFEVGLEIDQMFSGHNTEIYDCVVCCNPNKIDYEVFEGEVSALTVSDGNA